MRKTIIKRMALMAVSVMAMLLTVSGEQPCNECGGSGSVTCPTCQDRTYYTCKKSGGTGQVSYNGSSYTGGM